MDFSSNPTKKFLSTSPRDDLLDDANEGQDSQTSTNKALLLVVNPMLGSEVTLSSNIIGANEDDVNIIRLKLLMAMSPTEKLCN